MKDRRVTVNESTPANSSPHSSNQTHYLHTHCQNYKLIISCKHANIHLLLYMPTNMMMTPPAGGSLTSCMTGGSTYVVCLPPSLHPSPSALLLVHQQLQLQSSVPQAPEVWMTPPSLDSWVGQQVGHCDTVESLHILDTTLTQDLRWEIGSMAKKEVPLAITMMVHFSTAITESILTSSITICSAAATVKHCSVSLTRWLAAICLPTRTCAPPGPWGVQVRLWPTQTYWDCPPCILQIFSKLNNVDFWTFLGQNFARSCLKPCSFFI